MYRIRVPGGGAPKTEDAGVEFRPVGDGWYVPVRLREVCGSFFPIFPGEDGVVVQDVDTGAWRYVAREDVHPCCGEGEVLVLVSPPRVYVVAQRLNANGDCVDDVCIGVEPSYEGMHAARISARDVTNHMAMIPLCTGARPVMMCKIGAS